jgi:hypothetical protein
VVNELSKILIHSKVFLEELLKIKINHRKSLTYLFNNFIKEIANLSSNKIEIFNFAQEYNNPMTFFNEFIKQLRKENNRNIGKKASFEGMLGLNYEEDFFLI